LADEKEESKADVDDDGMSHAADEPTAVWDANTLREAGLGDLINRPESEPPPAATRGRRREQQGPSIVVDEAAAGARSEQVATSTGADLGWLSTVALAAGLGGAVYFLIRFLK
jgi:hypothetical protein